MADRAGDISCVSRPFVPSAAITSSRSSTGFPGIPDTSRRAMPSSVGRIFRGVFVFNADDARTELSQIVKCPPAFGHSSEGRRGLTDLVCDERLNFPLKAPCGEGDIPFLSRRPSPPTSSPTRPSRSRRARCSRMHAAAPGFLPRRHAESSAKAPRLLSLDALQREPPPMLAGPRHPKLLPNGARSRSWGDFLGSAEDDGPHGDGPHVGGRAYRLLCVGPRARFFGEGPSRKVCDGRGARVSKRRAARPLNSSSSLRHVLFKAREVLARTRGGNPGAPPSGGEGLMLTGALPLSSDSRPFNVFRTHFRTAMLPAALGATSCWAPDDPLPEAPSDRQAIGLVGPRSHSQSGKPTMGALICFRMRQRSLMDLRTFVWMRSHVSARAVGSPTTRSRRERTGPDGRAAPAAVLVAWPSRWRSAGGFLDRSRLS